MGQKIKHDNFEIQAPWYYDEDSIVHQEKLCKIIDTGIVLQQTWLTLKKKECAINNQIDRLLLLGVPGSSEKNYKKWKESN